MTTTPTASPTWYDVLDVEPDASAEEIRTAWKSAIADLEPGDRRFDSLNRAAKVLLDPAARAEYDATLAPDEKDVPDEPAGEGSAPDQHVDGRAARAVPTWLLIGLGVLAAVLVAASVWTWQRGDAASTDAVREAQRAAERAVVPVLSYDHADLEGSRTAARAQMTGSYSKEYDKLFAVIEENAPETETTVTASVVASGIVRTGEDRVQVLLFVDRPTTNKQTASPIVYKDQVTLSMQKVGEDWLVDDMVTSPLQE